jgi:hypothetical protein
MAQRLKWNRVREQNLMRKRGTGSALDPKPKLPLGLKPSSESKAVLDYQRRLAEQIEAEEATKRKQAGELRAKDAIAKTDRCRWCGQVLPIRELAAHLRTQHQGKKARFAELKKRNPS